MVYQDSFVAVVKCGSKVLRERDGTVFLPFGSSYSLLLKNLESRKASIKVSIDGQNVLGGSSLIIDPNSEAELQGILEGSVVKNRFKFIQKTKEIQDHRGDRIDDGIVRIEFAFEQVKIVERRQVIHDHHHYDHHHHYDYWPRPCWPRPYNPYWTWTDSALADGSSGVSGDETQVYNASTGNVKSTFTSDMRSVEKSDVKYAAAVADFSLPDMDEGITVKGEETHQPFVYSSIGSLDPSRVITIMLRGTKSGGNIEVEKPITVKTRLTCPTCGKRSRSANKFCSKCGTFLE